MSKKPGKDLGRVVFARVGWMRRYAGPVPGDERPVGGGKYNLKNIGSEVLNFKKRGGYVYGYFETAMANPETNLGRIDAAASEANSLDDVLVVFVAPHPDRGQVIVGWYAAATVLRQPKGRPTPDDDHSYRCIAKLTKAVLVPEPKRLYVIPSGAGAMGQSNVCYSLEADGTPKSATWMTKAVEYVRSYDGENVLFNEVADVGDEIAAEAEKALSRAQGRWIANAKQRKALEDYGVRRAMVYFRNEGYAVENVGAKSSYDVCCTKNGRLLCVEVKATTTSGAEVILTPREAALKGARALFLVHSVKLVKGKPSGGLEKVIRPWKVDPKRLKPISYMYTVPE